MNHAARHLKLSHPIHLHASHLGLPGNIESTLAALDAFDGHRMHLAHAQFYAYGRSNTGGYTSAATRLTDYLNQHSHLTCDVGQIIFGPAWVTTSDAVLKHRLQQPFSSPPDIPFPIAYKPNDPTNALQWAIGLELILSSHNLWQISLSVDHPNGGPFWAYPRILAWLMNKTLRDQLLDNIHPYAKQHSTLKQIDRELTLYEVAILTRAAPARSLGLNHKGHLGPGADADIAIYRHDEANPEKIFEQAKYLIKAGHVLINNGKVTHTHPATFLSR